MADVASALKEATEKMAKAVEVAKDDFGAIRTGRAHPAMFNRSLYLGRFGPMANGVGWSRTAIFRSGSQGSLPANHGS